jgi:heme A synthase
MRKTYSVIAWVIAAGVVVQAAAIAFGVGGMVHYVQEGGVVDKALIESREGEFTGVLGFAVHSLVGGILLPALALVLLLISFFTKVSGATKWAAVLFGLVFVQVMAGYSLKDMPYLGLLHGANALAILVTAVVTARRTKATAPSLVAEPASADVPV